MVFLGRCAFLGFFSRVQGRINVRAPGAVFRSDFVVSGSLGRFCDVFLEAWNKSNGFLCIKKFRITANSMR